MKSTLAALAAVTLAVSSAQAVVLYDGTLNSPSPANTPSQAPAHWTNLGLPDSTTAETGSVTGQVGFTTLTTTQGTGGMGATDGFFASKAAPFTDSDFGSLSLNRVTGYTVNFTIAVTAEAHNADNQRSGFDLIALSSDHHGVEIGFWTNSVFAYNDDTNFTPGESDAWNSTAMTSYTLSVLGDSYKLTSGATTLLQGTLRSNYSRINSLPDPPFATNDLYTIPDLLFMGDDTTRASATVNIAKVELLAGAVLPEPASLGMLAVGAAGLLFSPAEVMGMHENDPIAALLAYDQWCMERIVASMENLAPADLRREFPMGWRTLRATLYHVVMVAEVWADRSRPDPTGLRSVDDSGPDVVTVTELGERYRVVAARMAANLAALNAETEPGPAWMIRRNHLIHVTTHGMHHRAQMIFMLTQLGAPDVIEGGDFGGWANGPLKNTAERAAIARFLY